MFVYVGCRTTEHRNARGKGIEVFETAGTGKDWVKKQTLPILDNPSFLCFDRTKNYLYTVHGDFNEVSSFKIGTDGLLTHLNTVSSQGKNPVYVTPSINNKYIFCASLQGGAVASLPIQSDGSLGEAISTVHLAGLTPEGVSHAHQCELDRTGNWLLVPTQGRHIGYERVYIIKINNETGELTEYGHVTARTYAEPRTLAFSEDNKRVYLMNEKGNYVTYYKFDEQEGTLTPLQIIPSLPETYVGEGQASAILIHPNGKFVYGTNRIHESIVTYRVNEETGFLTTVEFNSVLGLTPRFFTFNEDASQLWIANEDSDTIRIFNVDAETGHLVFSDQTIETGSPTSIVYR